MAVLKETQTAYVLGLMLHGVLNAEPHPNIKSRNWTAKGSEAIVEVDGIFYKISVEPTDL